MLGRKKLTTRYRGKVNLLFHLVMANRHGDRIRFSVLLGEDCAQLLIEEAELQDQKPSSLIRDLVYQHVANSILSEINELEHN